MPMTTINIVIPTFNRQKLLERLLQQINEQKVLLKDVTYRTIVVVDGSTDGTYEMLASVFPEVQVVNGSGNLWYTRSMNLGFEKAYELGGDYILTLNDDVVLDNRYLQVMAQYALSGDECVIGSLSLTLHEPPRILFSGVRKYIRWRQKNIKYHPIFTVYDESMQGLHHSVVLPGRGILVSQFIVKKLNGFDDYFIQYHSDEDFCLRAAREGASIMVSWDAMLFSYIEKTAAATSYMRVPAKVFFKSFLNPYSRIYIPQKAKFYYRHGIILLWPVTMLAFFLSNIKAWLFNKKLV
jgi:GT2 family glycosyltransferase